MKFLSRQHLQVSKYDQLFMHELKNLPAERLCALKKETSTRSYVPCVSLQKPEACSLQGTSSNYERGKKQIEAKILPWAGPGDA